MVIVPVWAPFHYRYCQQPTVVLRKGQGSTLATVPSLFESRNAKLSLEVWILRPFCCKMYAAFLYIGFARMFFMWAAYFISTSRIKSPDLA